MNVWSYSRDSTFSSSQLSINAAMLRELLPVRATQGRRVGLSRQFRPSRLTQKAQWWPETKVDIGSGKGNVND